jgi:hypothetical protein
LFSIVPHAFGLSRPTIIDHRKLVKNKIGALPRTRNHLLLNKHA